MKLKTLLVSAVALLCSAGAQKLHAAAADYLSGWTEVTSMPVDLAEWSNYYYVFVATEADLMLAQEQGGSLDGDQQESKLTVVYRTPGDPSLEKKFVWMIDYDNTYLYGIRSLNNTTYYMQTRKNETYRVQFAWETAQSKWTMWDLVYADSKWTIQNKLAEGDGGGDNNWIGPWNTGAFEDNMVAAGNAGGNGNPKGTFKIYRIPCKDYISNVTNTYITNANLKDIAANSTTDGGFWPVYTDGRTGNTQHPKNWYLHTNGTTNHNGGGEFFECWTANQGVKRWTLFQDVTLPAGSYKLTGQYSTNENRGIIKTVAITPHHTYVSPGITSSNWGEWGSQTAEFTIYETTKVRVGMISTNFAQNHGFTLTTTTAHQFLADEIEAAPIALTSAIATAQGVYDNRNAGDDAYRTAAKNLHDAVEAYEISVASSSAPVDMTDKIANPSFEGVGGASDYTGANHACSEWTYCTSTDKGSYSATNKNHLITDDSNDGFYYMNLWGGVSTFFAKQTLTSLPAGRYKLTALYASDPDNTATLYMSSTSEGSIVTATAKDHFVEGVVIYDLLVDGDVEIGITSSKWFKVDGFQLQYLSSPATEDDYDALDDAIRAGDAKVFGFEAGEYAPYNNIEAVALLEAAKSIDQNAYNTHEDVQAAIESLNAAWTANAGEVNAFYDGTFSTREAQEESKDGTKIPGWTSGNNIRQILKTEATFPGLADATDKTALFVWSGGASYGNDNGYTMPLKANSIYKLGLKVAGWNNETRGNITVSVKNSEDGMAATVIGRAAKDISVGMTSFEILFATGAAGNYVFTMSSTNNIVFSDIELKKAASQTLTFKEDGSTPTFAAGTYPSVALDRTFNTANYSTLCLPFAMTAEQTSAAFSEAYEFNAVVGNSLKFVSASSIATGKPYLVKAKGADLSVSGVALDPTAVVDDVTHDGVTFKGTFSPIAALSTDGTCYVVSSNNLYQVNSPVGMDAYRAYFQTGGGSTKSFVLDFGDADAINDVKSKMEDEIGEIYNLAGQRLNKAQKGVNIINGKKVLVK